MPGRKRCAFLTPPTYDTAAVLRAALFASAFLGALEPVFLRAVCFVLAILFLLLILLQELNLPLKGDQSEINAPISVETPKVC